MAQHTTLSPEQREALLAAGKIAAAAGLLVGGIVDDGQTPDELEEIISTITGALDPLRAHRDALKGSL